MSVDAVLDRHRIKDIYPSRDGSKACLLERRDPVVYSGREGECPIEPNLIERYREQGFLILPNYFDEGEVGRLRAELDRLRSDRNVRDQEETVTEPDSGDVRSIFKVHEHNVLYGRLARDRRLAGVAQYLLGDRVYVHQSRVNYKPGFRGREFYWHSDFETWHVEDGMPRMRALSISILLTDNFPCNGPLMLVPGSHRYFVACRGETPKRNYETSLKHQELGVPGDRQLQELAKRGGIVQAIGKAGSMILFDCNVMHGSAGNITPYPRSNVFFVYNALTNRVGEPFGDQPARPDYLCARERIEPIEPKTVRFNQE